MFVKKGGLKKNRIKFQYKYMIIFLLENIKKYVIKIQMIEIISRLSL